MLGVSCEQLSSVELVFLLLPNWFSVVPSPADAQYASKMFPPSWVDFLQDG